MGKLKNFQHAVLALIAISVIALYGAAFAFPAERQHHDAALQWIPLPTVAPKNVAAISAASGAVYDAPDLTIRPVITVGHLRDKIGAASFDLATVRQAGEPVPRLFLDTLPRDFKSLSEVGALKQAFFQMVLPLALKVNEEILADRHQLLLMQKKVAAGRGLSGEQQAWLDVMAEVYDVPSGDLSELARRIDAISPALALAQSAEESGWGRSRFAVHGNALFGQRTWDKGLGIVPQQRDDGSWHEVRAFPSLLESVRSYARNLNGHPAYGEFRERRAEMRARGGKLDPYDLIETLSAYSERREHYVRTIQKILRIDRLEELENTQLESRSIKTTQALSRASER